MTRYAGSRTRRARRAAATVLALLVSTAITGQSASAKRPLTVADAIETTRVLGTPSTWTMSADGEFRNVPGPPAVVSPDGKRYAVVTVRGDLSRNGNWLEVWSAGLGSLDPAARLEPVARLFTTSLGSASGTDTTSLTLAHFNPVRWLDGERLAFFFSDGTEPKQAVAVDVRTGKLERLTRHPAEVVDFSAGPGGAFVFAARIPHPSDKSRDLLARGFAVTSRDLYVVLRGEVDGYGIVQRMWNTQRFVSTKSHPEPRLVVTNSRHVDRHIPLTATAFSPDGRLAIIDGTPEALPDGAEKYRGDFFRSAISEARHDPDGSAAGQIRQLFVLDVESGIARPLWKAIQLGSRVAWSPDGRSVVVGPAYLPPEGAAAAGLAGRAVAEVDVETGRYRMLPVPPDVESRGIGSVAWDPDGTVRIEDGVSWLRLRKRKREGAWEVVSNEKPGLPNRTTAAVRVELRQDRNTPPRLFAVETATGRERLVRDFNPGLAGFKLGRAEDVTWKDRSRRTWNGLLYSPVDRLPGQRYPLVIQTHGYADPGKFSLYGTGPGELALGLGPSYSVFAAQPLANRGIAVLQIEDKDPPGVTGTPAEPQMYMATYEAAVEHLAAAGLVDPARVGLVGYSRTGWHVEYTLTHSKFPYAAAIATDNFDGSYLQSLLLWTDEYTTDNGGAPYGDGLKAWLENAPGFNADKVATPLRLQIESAGLETILSKWEMFTRLRQLKKPVELYVAPDIEHGSHGLQNPRQCLAVQQGAVDWFDFWLNGREDPDPAKAEQYARWQKLREQSRTSSAQKPPG